MDEIINGEDAVSAAILSLYALGDGPVVGVAVTKLPDGTGSHISMKADWFVGLAELEEIEGCMHLLRSRLHDAFRNILAEVKQKP